MLRISTEKDLQPSQRRAGRAQVGPLLNRPTADPAGPEPGEPSPSRTERGPKALHMSTEPGGPKQQHQQRCGPGPGRTHD